jgi:hypothetical protein
VFNYVPPYYTIEVQFKPKGVPAYEASDFKSVEFQVKCQKPRSKYYSRAIEKAVDDGVIDSYGIEYWEPFRIHITCPSAPRTTHI